MFILANAPAQQGSSISWIIFVLPLLLIGWMIYRQRQQGKQMTEMQAQIKVGDFVRTTSGIFGSVVSLDDEVVELEIADGVVIHIDKRALVALPPQEETPEDDAE